MKVKPADRVDELREQRPANRGDEVREQKPANRVDEARFEILGIGKKTEALLLVA